MSQYPFHWIGQLGFSTFRRSWIPLQFLVWASVAPDDPWLLETGFRLITHIDVQTVGSTSTLALVPTVLSLFLFGTIFQDLTHQVGQFRHCRDYCFRISPQEWQALPWDQYTYHYRAAAKTLTCWEHTGVSSSPRRRCSFDFWALLVLHSQPQSSRRALEAFSTHPFD